MTLATKTKLYTVELDGKPVPYSIRLSPGSVRRRIRVSPNGIEVVIPRGGKAASASEFLKTNEKWILEQLEFVERSSGIFRGQSRPRSLLVAEKWIVLGSAR